MSILVVGAGACGLATALLLARDGHAVTVLERDDDPMPAAAADAWEAWSRKGVAQFRQPHNLMPGLRRLLESELPDVQEGLARAGAARYDLLHPLPPMFSDRSPRPIDDQLWTYTGRRPVLEWVFAEAAHSQPGLTLRRGSRVAGLLTGARAHPGAPHVAGVRLESGEEVKADLVVDATGRGSRSTWGAASPRSSRRCRRARTSFAPGWSTWPPSRRSSRSSAARKSPKGSAPHRRR